METETAANPADEVVNLDAGTATSDTGANTHAEGGSDDFDALTKEALGDTAPANLDFVEIDFDGRKLKVSSVDGTPIDPDLNLGVMRDGDYRKKTMALSDERKAYQQERDAFAARANLTGEAALRSNQLHALDAEIRNLSAIPIQVLYEQGFTDDQIEEARHHLQARQTERNNLAARVSQDVGEFQRQTTEAMERSRADARRKASLQDKALTPERIDRLEAFAVEAGFAPEAVKSISTPEEIQVLHWAEIGKQFIERQRKAANFRAAAAGSPAATLSGVTAGQKAPEAMSMAEYAAWREAGNG